MQSANEYEAEGCGGELRGRMAARSVGYLKGGTMGGFKRSVGNLA